MVVLLAFNINSNAGDNGWVINSTSVDNKYGDVEARKGAEAYSKSKWYVGVEQVAGDGDFSLYGDEFDQPISEFVNTDLTQTRLSFGRKAGKDQMLSGSQAGFYAGKGVESTSVGVEFKIVLNESIGIPLSEVGSKIQPYLSGHFGLGWFDDKGTTNRISTNFNAVDYITKSHEQIMNEMAPDNALMTENTKYQEIGSGIGVMFTPSENISLTAGYEFNARAYSLTYGLESKGSTFDNDLSGVFDSSFTGTHSFRAGINYAF